jgi:hypothetical protein
MKKDRLGAWVQLGSRFIQHCTRGRITTWRMAKRCICPDKSYGERSARSCSPQLSRPAAIQISSRRSPDSLQPEGHFSSTLKRAPVTIEGVLKTKPVVRANSPAACPGRYAGYWSRLERPSKEVG